MNDYSRWHVRGKHYFSKQNKYIAQTSVINIINHIPLASFNFSY